MKRHQKIIAALAAATAGASVPLRWTVDTSRVDPAVFDVVRGETVELKAAFNSYGKPLDMGGKDVSIFWQTNGMGSAWWSAPAAAAGNTVTAAFTPAMDPGAASVSGFLGVPGEIYRGAFVLRFRHGPGAVPNELELPRKSIDFATVEVKNAPWAAAEDVAAALELKADKSAISATDPTFSNAVMAVTQDFKTNTYTKTETDALIAANKPEYEDVPSNVVWRIEADGGRFFFKPVRPINMED